jgi:hypothetical protein
LSAPHSRSSSCVRVSEVRTQQYLDNFIA